MIGATFQLGATFGVARSGGIEKTSLISLTSEERRGTATHSGARMQAQAIRIVHRFVRSRRNRPLRRRSAAWACIRMSSKSPWLTNGRLNQSRNCAVESTLSSKK